MNAIIIDGKLDAVIWIENISTLALIIRHFPTYLHRHLATVLCVCVCVNG